MATQRQCLQRSFQSFSYFERLWKVENPAKIIKELCQIINAMKDLLKLPRKNRIESKLYNGDTIQRI